MTGPSGQIYRLTSAAYATASAACPSNTHPQANVIIKGMRQYGIILADNGMTGGLIGTPDSRWQTEDLACLTNIALSQFEPVNVSSLRISADSGATKSVRLMHNGAQVNLYATFNSAYTAAGDEDTIQAKAFKTNETLTFAGSINVVLKGGYDSAFETNSLMTTIHGSLTVGGTGKLTIDRVIID
jgi:hypothetical protein